MEIGCRAIRPFYLVMFQPYLLASGSRHETNKRRHTLYLVHLSERNFEKKDPMLWCDRVKPLSRQVPLSKKGGF